MNDATVKQDTPSRIIDHYPYTLRVYPTNLSKHRTYEVERDGKVIATWDYNYPADVYAFITTKEGKDYLLMTETYHGGQGCIDLQTGEKVTYDPKDDKAAPTGGFSEIFPSQREFWCWVQIGRYDQDNKTLQVEGCYWACPFSIRTFSMLDPMKLPYTVVAETYVNDEDNDAEE